MGADFSDHSGGLFQTGNQVYLACMALSLKPYLPRSLFGRAALILVAPVVTLQFTVSIVFIQRHYDRVTEQLTSAAILDIQLVLQKMAADDPQTRELSRALKVNYKKLPSDQPLPRDDQISFFDLAGRSLISTIHRDLPNATAVDVLSQVSRVTIFVQTARGPIQFDLERGRFTATNPHQLLVLLLFTGLLMILIAFVFMRNQLIPITRLAAAANAFGRGEHIPYVTRGATEVREAGQAFLAMRARIERQIESRTLLLSGISHDLRSPLTRLKLGLTLLPQDEATEDLFKDIADMERLVDEFLAFVRGDAMEETSLCDPQDLLRQAVSNGLRAHQSIQIFEMADAPPISLRPLAIMRALENLLGNAVRYGTHAQVSLAITAESLRFIIEDDGPGIPEQARALALEPFHRLDAARDPNRGGGVGLGLSIAADIARSHGGAVILSDSTRLGGLRVELRIAR